MHALSWSSCCEEGGGGRGEGRGGDKGHEEEIACCDLTGEKMYMYYILCSLAAERGIFSPLKCFLAKIVKENRTSFE